jgi:hypothetical protein
MRWVVVDTKSAFVSRRGYFDVWSRLGRSVGVRAAGGEVLRQSSEPPPAQPLSLCEPGIPAVSGNPCRARRTLIPTGAMALLALWPLSV